MINFLYSKEMDCTATATNTRGKGRLTSFDPFSLSIEKSLRTSMDTLVEEKITTQRKRMYRIRAGRSPLIAFGNVTSESFPTYTPRPHDAKPERRIAPRIKTFQILDNVPGVLTLVPLVVRLFECSQTAVVRKKVKRMVTNPCTNERMDMLLLLLDSGELPSV